jgi:hypothetical protein
LIVARKANEDILCGVFAARTLGFANGGVPACSVINGGHSLAVAVDEGKGDEKLKPQALCLLGGQGEQAREEGNGCGHVELREFGGECGIVLGEIAECHIEVRPHPHLGHPCGQGI